MKKFLVEESGYYKIRMKVEAKDEYEAQEKAYDCLPNFVDFESQDIEVTEVEDDI